MPPRAHGALLVSEGGRVSGAVSPHSLSPGPWAVLSSEHLPVGSGRGCEAVHSVVDKMNIPFHFLPDPGQVPAAPTCWRTGSRPLKAARVPEHVYVRALNGLLCWGALSVGEPPMVAVRLHPENGKLGCSPEWSSVCMEALHLPGEAVLAWARSCVPAHAPSSGLVLVCKAESTVR